MKLCSLIELVRRAKECVFLCWNPGHLGIPKVSMRIVKKEAADTPLMGSDLSVATERQIFEKFFMAILFAFRVYARNLLKGSRRHRNIFSYFRFEV